MGIKIDITPKDLKTVKDLLKQYLPNTLVWAFGSRVKFTAKPTSDLDLAAFISKEQELKFSLLKEALDESSIPFRIDLHNWHELPETFHKNIESSFVVLQEDAKKEMPSEWKTYKLGEIAELRKEQIIPNGIEQTYIGLEHIEQQSLRLNGVGSSNNVISNKFKFYSGDILYGKLRPYFRKVYQPKFEGVCSTDIYVIKNKKPVDRDFLYYLIATEEFTNIANSGSSGTRMPRADWKQLQNSEWNLPNIETQRQIAQILTSLDDKIALNLQMNQTLEAMAQAIFKEWFVNFNFPGSESEKRKVKSEKSDELSTFHSSLITANGLPKGWRKGSVLEIATLLSGGTPKTSEPDFWDGEINWISAKDITSSNNQFIIETEKTITELGIKKSAAKLLPTFTTIISARGTVGNFCILPKKMAISQSNYGLKSKSDYDFFLFLLVKNMLSMMKAFAYGAVFDTITTKTFEAMEITIPENQVIDKFENLIKPIYTKILTNQLQIQSLTQTRDTLLPKLMSGVLKVKSEK